MHERIDELEIRLAFQEEQIDALNLTVVRQQQELDEFPSLRRWFDAIRNRPATIRAYARGEPFASRPAVTEEGKKLLFVDDSIVRGTQMRETVEFLYENGAKEVHMRSACPPIMYGCKYLNFSRGNSDMELLARRVIQELEGDEGHKHLDEYSDSSTERGQCLLKSICEKFGFDSLGYQSLDGVLEAIGIDRDKVCTYCWNGKE